MYAFYGPAADFYDEYPDIFHSWKRFELTESFLDNFSEENREKELREFQNIQKVYLEKGYELELEQKIRETLEKEA